MIVRDLKKKELKGVKMKGLILAGGLGKRFYPLSHTGPKQLFPLANKPIIFYGIEDLKNAGVKEIGIVVGYTEERIKALKDTIGDGSKWGVNITYIKQKEPLGLADAVSIAEDFINGEDFIVYLGDNILKGGISSFVSKFKESDADCMLLLSEVEDPRRYGVVVLGDENNVAEIEEKPEKPKSNMLAIVGIYFFKPTIFEFAKNVKPGKKGELQITDAIRNLIQNGNNVKAHKVENWWDDLGKAEDVLHANHLLLMDLKNDIQGKIDKNVKLIGNIQIGEGSVIKENTTIKGPVLIGKNCKIGPNAYIGPYTSIGENVVITDAEIESSIILDDVNINLKKKIIDSLIGKQATISASDNLPKGHRFIIGENSDIRM